MNNAIVQRESSAKASDEISAQSDCLAYVSIADANLKAQFSHCLEVEPLFTRQLVSFQASKNEPSYRWFKYKEAFSAALVRHLLTRDNPTSEILLDPFAGSGTALFAATDMGFEAHGIELLPVGRQIFDTRRVLEEESTDSDFSALKRFIEDEP